MQAESPAAVDPEALPSEGLMIKDGDSSIPLSPPKDVGPQMPAKKQTRQWAAWTRQEEESFFNALRLVGKNFEKITCRVQSKNKDQVRHYYYRLLRRMKKLLGPGFSLDTKNTKDTISAMLRWWSLLEKHSCTSSKLRLKPRRFKIFVEALEHQLLRDRKKTQKKRPLPGENIASSPSAVPLLTKTEGNDVRTVRLVVVDGQNIQKVGSGKAAPLKRNGSMNISCNRSDLSPVKTSKQRRRTGTISSAAYKRWEKAAIAGVSLVADAAEQLERTTADRNVDANHGTLDVNATEPLPLDCHSFLSPTSDGMFTHNPNAQISSQSSVKLKLQLFPIDEVTRRALEKDELNPHLELTLSSRKKIVSVLEHLNHKWGNSRIASGELVLFPYSLQQQSISASCQAWTLKDTTSSAADVYAAIGKPPIFRLRYGWFSNTELRSLGVPPTSVHLEDCKESDGFQESMKAAVGNTGAADLTVGPELVNQPSIPDSHDPKIQEFSIDQENDCPLGSDYIDTGSFLEEDDKGGVARKQCDDSDNMRLSNSAPVSAGEWADSLTNISIGELLSEASRGMNVNCIDSPVARSDSNLHQIPFNSDSFDAAIAAHLSGPHNTPALCTQMSHASIWDAEETCDAFSFRKVSSAYQEVYTPSPSTSFRDCREISHSNSLGFHGLIEDLSQNGEPEKPVKEEDHRASCHSDIQSEDDAVKNLSLTDMYWPDSLGPLDLDICPRYQSPEMILGDSASLGGLNRLIASSLDAFQNCTFFDSDKIESPASET